MQMAQAPAIDTAPRDGSHAQPTILTVLIFFVPWFLQ
jgi:hypothetical protein